MLNINTSIVLLLLSSSSTLLAVSADPTIIGEDCLTCLDFWGILLPEKEIKTCQKKCQKLQRQGKVFLDRTCDKKCCKKICKNEKRFNACQGTKYCSQVEVNAVAEVLYTNNDKCISGSPQKYLKNALIEKNVPAGKKCCISPKTKDDAIFVDATSPCPCSLLDLQSCDFPLQQDDVSFYTYNIENVNCAFAETNDEAFWTNSLFTQTGLNSGFKYIGEFDGLNDDGSVASYNNGTPCPGGVPRKGTLVVERTGCLDAHRKLTALEQPKCEYTLTQSCYDPDFPTICPV